jgi:ElaB/YqjD/DUF883 family membrane-anchored ribosome-binding protein
LNVSTEDAKKLSSLTKGYAFAFQVLGMLYYDKKESETLEDILPKLDEMLDDFSRDPKHSITDGEESNTMVERLIKKMSTEIKDMMGEREKNSLTDDEVKVGTALTELLDHWEDVLNVDGSNKLQKSSVLYFLREETMMTTKQVRDNMKHFKNAYYLLKKGMIEDDE